MMSLILTVAMIPSAPAATAVAQIQTCVWPHICAKAAPLPPLAVAQAAPCVWPRVCGAPSKA